jgi:hypothetical protein
MSTRTLETRHSRMGSMFSQAASPARSLATVSNVQRNPLKVFAGLGHLVSGLRSGVRVDNVCTCFPVSAQEAMRALAKLANGNDEVQRIHQLMSSVRAGDCWLDYPLAFFS